MNREQIHLIITSHKKALENKKYYTAVFLNIKQTFRIVKSFLRD